MNCPKCNGETAVTDSRSREDIVHRRRKCMVCGYRFGTDEIDSYKYKLLKDTKEIVVEKMIEQMKKHIQFMERIIET